jgi:PAS domain S-box-containing protein
MKKENAARSKDFAENRKAESKAEFLNAILEHVPEGLALISSPEQKVLFISEQAAKWVGRRREELEGAAGDEIVERWDVLKSDGVTRPQKHEFIVDRTIIQGGYFENEEWVFRKPNGARITVLINSCPAYGENGEIMGAVLSWVDISGRKAEEEKIRNLNNELNEALRKVRVLSGMMKVCASCRRVQDDRGNWLTLEKYIEQRSEASFSHGICPDCAEKAYKEMEDEDRY